MNDHYNPRGYKFILKAWEFIDPTYRNKRKQDQYNDVIRQCDLFVALFHTKVGKYTVEELKVARHECETRQMPLFIYFRDLDYWQALQKQDENLEAIKKYIGDDMQHFWGSYKTNDKLHLDFVLWLDSYLFDGKAPFKVENGLVMLDDVKVANMSGLPFAANNNEYQQLEERLNSLYEDIEQIRQDIQDDPDNKKFPERLRKKEKERDKVQEKLEVQQEALLGAARKITEMRKQQVGKKLQEAIDAFEAGQLDEANKILEGLQKEGEQLIKDFETNREQIHEHIDALLLQTETVMADVNIPIEERITRVAEIYAQADDWATRSAYDKKKYTNLLFDYGQFLYKYGLYDKGIQIYFRLIPLSEELNGKESTDTATHYNNIGAVYDDLGDYDKALEYYFKALDIERKVLGEEHPETATTYNNIGGVYYKQDDYDKALEYYFKALEIFRKVLGEEHPNTAITYGNIADVYFGKGEEDKALEYFRKAEEIEKKRAGGD